MKMTSLIYTAALLTVASSSFAMTQQSLNQYQTTHMLQNKTITTVSLVTINKKLVTNSLTAYFDKNGTITGKLSEKPSDSVQNDQGKWTAKPNGTLCVTWEQWNNHEPICVSVFNLNNTILFVNTSNNNFESMVLKTDIRTGNQL
jgi:hypothetical protein